VHQFGLIRNLTVDAPVFAQPLSVSGVPVGGSSHNLLIVATENDSVYAFDAASLSQTPFWQSSLLGSGEVPAAPFEGCPDLMWSNTSDPKAPALGVTATPVIAAPNKQLLNRTIYEHGFRHRHPLLRAFTRPRSFHGKGATYCDDAIWQQATSISAPKE
jgi:hypothetical protein